MWTLWPQNYVSCLDHLDPGEADRRFAQLFSRSQDKVWRLNRNVSDTHRHPTFYLQDGQGITPSIRRRAIASFDLLSERGPALVPPYFSAYVDFVERGLMVYSPGIDWGRRHPANRQFDLPDHDRIGPAQQPRTPPILDTGVLRRRGQGVDGVGHTPARIGKASGSAPWGHDVVIDTLLKT